MKENFSFPQKAGFEKTCSFIYPYNLMMCGCIFFLAVLLSLTGSATEINKGRTNSSGECGAVIAPLTGTSCTATSETVKYGFRFKNTGSKPGIFLITSANEKSSLLNNPDHTSTQTNAGLISECRDVNNNPISKIEIQPNQEIVFYLLVFVPKDSPRGVWNSIMVKVNSVLCPETEITIPVFTYIPDPKKDVFGFINTDSFNQKLFCMNPEMVFIMDGLI